jgi:adenylate cyclase
MSVPPRRRYVLRAAAGFILPCVAIGGIYPVLLPVHSVATGLAAGLLVGLSITVAELAWFQTEGKRMRFLPYLVLQTAYYVAVVDLAVVAVTLFHGAIFRGIGPVESFASGPILSMVESGAFLRLNAWVLAAALLVNFVRQVNRVLGRRTLLDFLTGRYHGPVEEERVFMALDLKAAPQIASALGHRRYHEFLNDFFFDITPAIVESRGEIYQYVGDEVIVTWPKRADGAPADSVYCYFRVAAAVARTAHTYEAKYGFVPEFRAGIHYGPVVTGFIGDIKRDIVFHGDTVGTASRIKAECATVNKNLLLSGDLLKNTTLSGSLTPERMGRIRMKGKEKEIELYTLAEAA